MTSLPSLPPEPLGVDEKTLQTTTQKDFTFKMKIFENGGNGMPTRLERALDSKHFASNPYGEKSTLFRLHGVLASTEYTPLAYDHTYLPNEAYFGLFSLKPFIQFPEKKTIFEYV
ncbi:hypothetical protein TNCV_4937731 [Trichonephila clavipes]|nr:hypothetical protein TNCV_4937731 [Trichonephila clavipes]